MQFVFERGPLVRWLWVAAALGITATPQGLAQSVGDSVTVSGTATYRQRVAMPAEALLTVRVENVSRADAPAGVVAEIREPFGARQVPIAFSLAVPRAAIDSRRTYSLRATITVGGELRFTTTRHYPVLTRDAPNDIDLPLDAVQPAAASRANSGPDLAFTLPATFAGVLPCADCPGIAHTLTLRADGLYRMRRTYLGRPGAPVAEVGRWTVDPLGKQLALGRGPASQRFAVVDDQTLRQLDRRGLPFTSAANIELRRTAQVDAITELLRWRGEFRYLADAATFTDCASGLRWPVAMAGDYLALERLYQQQRSAPGAALLVGFDGRLEVRAAMEGPPREHIVVDRSDATEPGAACDNGPG